MGAGWLAAAEAGSPPEPASTSWVSTTPTATSTASRVPTTARRRRYVVSGTEWVEEHLKLRPRRLIAARLLLALATGAGSFVAGRPLLTSHAWHARLPVLGEVHLPSATFFDLGIFALVVGSTLFILTALAHQSVRAHRDAEKR